MSIDEMISTDPVVFYVDACGVLLGGWQGSAPENAIAVSPPDYADQVWLFPGWSQSPSALRRVENEWRSAEMEIAADNVTAIQFQDPGALPGTEAAWKAYWVSLRNWSEGKGGYPDITKRPKRPS